MPHGFPLSNPRPALLGGVVVRQFRARRRKRIVSQLPAFLEILSGHVRAGHSIPESLQEAIALLPSGIREEVSWLCQSIRLGVPLPDALRVWEQRMACEELSLIVRPLCIAIPAGENHPCDRRRVAASWVAFHPPDHVRAQMKALEFLSFGISLFAGFSLMVRFFQRSSFPGRVCRLPDQVIAAHRKAQGTLVGGKVVSIPGGMLVTSLRGWMAGEIVWISVVSVSLAVDPSLSSAIFSFFLGLGLGVCTLFLSIREQEKRQVGSVRSPLSLASFRFSLLLEAGMGSHSAFQEVGRAIPKGPLSRELDEISRARMLGISREEALERSRRRIPLDDYQIFLNLVHQGEQLGAGLSRGLREHSTKMLEGEGYRAEAAAQKAAVKLLFPLVAFIFPAVVLIIFSPILLNVWEMWGQ